MAKLSEELEKNTGLKEAVDGKVQMNWAERLEGFVASYEAYKEEALTVIKANEIMKEVAEESPRHHEKIVRESIKGFDQIINMQKKTVDTINLKISAANRLLAIIKENKEVAITDFLTDFDIVAGQNQ